MSRSAWILAAVCATGLVLGWVVMGLLVHSEGERPPLVQKIQSLPTLRELPRLPPAAERLIDSIESPGGPVWTLWGSASATSSRRPLLCRFDRRSEGGVSAPHCFPVAGDPKLASQAQFALGDHDPILIAPNPSVSLGVEAYQAESGEARVIDETQSTFNVHAEPGIRLIRNFVLTRSTPPQLARISPGEGHYVGPITGFAATRPPALARPAPGDRLESCVTPTGYIQSRLHTARQQAAAQPQQLEVTFITRGEVVATTHGSLPAERALDAPLSCTPTEAIFNWVEPRGRVARLSCSPKGCERSSASLQEIPVDRIVTFAQAGPSLVIVWRDDHGEPLVRLGPLDDFEHSPTAPLWKPSSPGVADAAWRVGATIATGHSLLLFIDQQGLRVIQIAADGSLEALAPGPPTPPEHRDH